MGIKSWTSKKFPGWRAYPIRQTRQGLEVLVALPQSQSLYTRLFTSKVHANIVVNDNMDLVDERYREAALFYLAFVTEITP